jgi:hypothetical protein
LSPLLPLRFGERRADAFANQRRQIDLDQKIGERWPEIEFCPPPRNRGTIWKFFPCPLPPDFAGSRETG